jgi:hypothetical protein
LDQRTLKAVFAGLPVKRAVDGGLARDMTYIKLAR